MRIEALANHFRWRKQGGLDAIPRLDPSLRWVDVCLTLRADPFRTGVFFPLWEVRSSFANYSLPFSLCAQSQEQQQPNLTLEGNSWFSSHHLQRQQLPLWKYRFGCRCGRRSPQKGTKPRYSFSSSPWLQSLVSANSTLFRTLCISQCLWS